MSQSGSFIPQQRKTVTRTPRRRVYLIGYFVYIPFFGVLVTAAVMAVWNWQLNNALAVQQRALNEERSSFKQSDMILVREMDETLSVISYVLNQQPAVTRLLTALEETTVGSIQIKNFEISSTNAERTLSDSVLVTYTGSTDNFDAVLAQRDVMMENEILKNASVMDISYTNAPDLESGLVGNVVEYDVTLELPLSALQFQGSGNVSIDLPDVPTAPVADIESATSSDEVISDEPDETVEGTDTDDEVVANEPPL